MTTLMHDVERRLADRGESMHSGLLARDILYADDALIVETSAPMAEKVMNCVSEVGSEYGLTFNWQKLRFYWYVARLASALLGAIL